ncbi:S41 family peptidase [Roseibacterium sp. SDUM158016]|uniref:S41 family peptidase n=1 Tax=Roseicyclus sediminis TaxID=2980997 RepID=UPI0021D00E95|nr:S41 family peptidase [Roseibacterium sp. SDUM158016]MCU4654253.1 S41 family peptidase [Roseibacterium sp. SDUM158016]
MIQDLEKIERTVLPIDPSFRAIEREETDRHINEARQNALANDKDEFLLSLMRLLALPGNGHTRLIPNNAILVLPLRFVTIGTAVRLLGAPAGFAGAIGSELISINGVPVSEIEVAAEKFLAGTRQRKRVVGPILFSWPGALARLGAFSGSGTIEYLMRDDTGRISELVPDMANRVPGSALYPRNEHGRADASWSPKTFLEIRDFGQCGLLLVLPSFFDPGETELSNAVAEAAGRARSRPCTPLVIDVRGNTGGNFLRTLPLIDAILEGAEDRRVGVLVDKFTFSAAIVFVAILKHRLGERLELIGEEMGDGLTFFAEGGTIDLSTGGAVVRYSSAFHDWAQGRIDETTPSEIAEEIVPVGTLELDRTWIANSEDVESRDLFCREVLESLNS